MFQTSCHSLDRCALCIPRAYRISPSFSLPGNLINTSAGVGYLGTCGGPRGIAESLWVPGSAIYTRVSNNSTRRTSFSATADTLNSVSTDNTTSRTTSTAASADTRSAADDTSIDAGVVYLEVGCNLVQCFKKQAKSLRRSYLESSRSALRRSCRFCDLMADRTCRMAIFVFLWILQARLLRGSN